MSLIQGNSRKSSVSGFYPKTIEGSLRFNDDDSAYLSWTPDSAGDQKTWTFSCWIKFSYGTAQNIFTAGADVNNRTHLDFNANGTFQIESKSGGSEQCKLEGTPFYRDPSAWYHLVWVMDTTQSTPLIKVWINNQEVIFSSTNYGTQNFNTQMSNQALHTISKRTWADQNYFNGYMAEVHFLNGIAATPDDFGELKNGVWVAKAYEGDYDSAAQVTANTLNGFYLNFQDDTEVEAFNTVLYRGNGLSSSSVTGMGFEPDLVWIKARDGAYNHILFDSVRGVGKYLPSSEAFAENWAGDLFPNSKPTTDGFIVDGHLNVSINESGKKYVAWGWKAGGAPTVDNSAGAGNIPTTGSVKIDGVNSTSELAGTIPATRLSASTTYGFSIVSYTGTGTAGDTVGHELDSVPDVVIVKNRDDSDSWQVYHSGIANAEEKYLRLNYLGKAEDSNTRWNDTAPSSSVFTLGSAVDVNNLNEDYIAYCWAETAGYSKFDSFAGEGSNNTTISKRIYTTNDGTVSGTGGFRPSMIIFKRTDIDSVNGWYMFDSTRDTDSVVGHPLFPDQTYTEGGTESVIEFNDDGFTIVRAYQDYCGAGGTYVYMAFADTRDAAFWLDQSGNDNDWQPVNLDHNDTVADSPTDNFATLNPLSKGNNVTLSDGNLKAVSGSPYSPAVSTIGVSSGKWYVEAETLSNNLNIGITAQSHLGTTSYLGQTADSWCYATDGNIYNGGSSVLNTGTTYTVGDVVGMALDMDAGDMYVYKNGDPVYSGNAVVTGLSGTYYIGVGASNSTMVINFGQQPFKHDPPA